MTVHISPGTSKGGDKVKVIVRIRPFNRRENGTNSVVELVDHCTIRLSHQREKGPKLFAFDFCFSAVETEIDQSVLAQLPDQQQCIFDSVGAEVVDNAFLGLNSCVFAYGQTGSGKSYTMMGTSEEPGIVPRLCTELFERLARETSEDGIKKFKLEVSFFEVYNERIRDLLGPSSAKSCVSTPKRIPSLKVREHSLLGPMVEGLSVYKVTNYDQIERLINAGNGARTTAETLMNETSSRSHSVFSLKLTQTIADADDRTFTGEKVSKISLVDLAGSERAQKTGAVGKRLEEGGNINRSLSALGKVIAALSEKRGSQFVPYRDSVLTWLLKENLGGNSRTTMIATVSPAADNYEETLSTLRFADRAKRIRTHAVINEDPNAKVIRELREEVERLRQLNQSHAEQNEQYQQAMEQITQRHNEEKSRALEAQYEQFTQYIAQLSSSSNNQQQQSVQSPSTPMTPFGAGIVPSISMANGIFCLGQRDKGKFLEWAQRRQELFAVHLAFLRKSIQHAAALADEANAAVAATTAKGTPRVHFAVSLHIPAGNLRPSKLIIAGGDDATEGEETTDGEGEGEESGCMCEPIIVAKWRGKRWAQQQWTVEQMECKLADLRARNNNNVRQYFSVENSFNLPLFGNLLARREKHTLIGVANVYLGHLLLNEVPSVDSQVLVINQQGEISGKMIVRVDRTEVRSEHYDEEEEEEDEEEDEDEEEGRHRHNERPGKYLGGTMRCRVHIHRLISLPSDHCRLVFCQYSFHECPQVVVPSAQGTPGAQSTAVEFNSANEFEVCCTRPFLDYLEEDALSVEVWGHRTVPDEDEEEEGEEKEEGERGQNENGRNAHKDEAKPTAQKGRAEDDEAYRRHCDVIHRNLCDLADEKKKSLRERWNEVTRRIELWVELLELNSAGVYVPVAVKGTNDGTLASCGTGGVYRLRHGQQRRIRLHLKSTGQSADFAQGTLPIRFSEIHSVSIGSPIVVDEREALTLDSYQETDLARIRGQWNELLQRRANYLQGQIQSLSSKTKSEFEGECEEHSLLQNWLELVEERNAIFLPSPGIPGAPIEWHASTSEENASSAVGFERHCPLIFLQGEESDENCNQNVIAGLANVLPMERVDECQLEMPLLEKQIEESFLECSCPWDSSLLDCPALNRNSRPTECVFLILKFLFSISHPFPAEIVLRKRICLCIGETNSNFAVGSSIWPWAKKTEILTGTGTGLFVDIVACIPKCSVGFERREELAKLAVQHATNSSDQTEDGDLSLVSFGSSALPGALADYSPRDGAKSNYLSEYVSKTISAVEWLIKLDRLRQEEAIRRAMAKLSAERAPKAEREGCRASDGRMTRTISLPTSFLPPLHLSNFNLISSKQISPDDVQQGDGQNQSVPFASWLTAFRQQQNQSPPLAMAPSQMVKSSQSHTDGFCQLLHHQSRPPFASSSSSASSSGYASMVSPPTAVSSANRSFSDFRQIRPNSLNLTTPQKMIRKTISMSFVSPTDTFAEQIEYAQSEIATTAANSLPAATAPHNSINSIVNPCANRLAGIDEEETAIGWGGSSSRRQSTTIGESGENEGGEEETAVEEGWQAAEEEEQKQQQKGAIGAFASPEGTNCCTSKNPLMRDAFRQLPSSNGLVEALSASSFSSASSSSSACCCAENRLFLCSPQQRGLTFPPPIRPSGDCSSSSSSSASSSASSSSSSSSFALSSVTPRRPFFFHKMAKTIVAEDENEVQQQGMENMWKKNPMIKRRMSKNNAKGNDGEEENCQRRTDPKKAFEAPDAVSRMGFLN
ncbi:hypothetical protein niasHS_000587 [Heterodera schachtii]|uniref:Kinesin motor domain-containing protein n=1 Tax=Heterodera schachtii TaxID=97005 RepID=A0ABD2K4N7_HETSC